LEIVQRYLISPFLGFIIVNMPFLPIDASPTINIDDVAVKSKELSINLSMLVS